MRATSPTPTITCGRSRGTRSCASRTECAMQRSASEPAGDPRRGRDRTTICRPRCAMTEAAIPSFEALVPMLPVTDVTRAIDFYRQLGFDVGGTHTPEGLSAPVGAWLRRRGPHRLVNRPDARISATHARASVCVYTQDVQSAHAALRSRGLDRGTIDHPPYNP